MTVVSQSVLPFLLASITALLALVLQPRVLERLSPATGDEIFYLVTAASLWDDHSINEARQWDTERWRQFYPRYPLAQDFRGWPQFPDPLGPHASQTARPLSEVYSKHGLGVPLLIAPAYGLGGRAGALTLYALLGGLLAANVYLLAWQTSESRAAAIFVWAALCLSTPLFPYLLVIFPALPAALLTTYAFRWLLRWDEAGSWRRLAVGTALGFLPWLHTVYLLLTLPLAAALLWRDRQSVDDAENARLWPERNPWNRESWWLPPLFFLGALVVYHLYLYGALLPNVHDHAGFNLPDVASWDAAAASAGPMLAGMAGVLLDGQWGLIMSAPVYLAALASSLTLVARRPRMLTALGLALPYCVAITLYRHWWGEWCPPARYLAPVAPLAAVPLAALMRGGGWRGVTLAALLAVPGVAVTLLYAVDPQLMFQHPTRESVVVMALAELLGAPDGAAWAAWLPSYVPRYDYLGVIATPLGRNLVWALGVLVFGIGAGWWIQTGASDELRLPKK